MQILIKLSSDEHQKVKRLADAAGVTITALIRQRLHLRPPAPRGRPKSIVSR